jgi:hypothetical protein
MSPDARLLGRFLRATLWIVHKEIARLRKKYRSLLPFNATCGNLPSTLRRRPAARDETTAGEPCPKRKSGPAPERQAWLQQLKLFKEDLHG